MKPSDDINFSAISTVFIIAICCGLSASTIAWIYPISSWIPFAQGTIIGAGAFIYVLIFIYGVGIYNGVRDTLSGNKEDES